MPEEDKPRDEQSQAIRNSTHPNAVSAEGKLDAGRKSVQHQRRKNKKPKGRHVRRDVIENIIEAIGLVRHGFDAVLAHVLGVVPEHPVKGIGFVAVLMVFAFYIGTEHRESERLCYASLTGLTVVALGLVVVTSKNPGNDERLRELQKERERIIAVKPFRYKDNSDNSIDEDSRD